MKMKEILEKQGDQLGHELVEKQKHLFDLRSQAVTEKLEDPSQLAKTKKDIARIKTVMRHRELEQQKQATAQATAGQAAGEQAAGEQQKKQGQDADVERPGARAPAFGRKTRVNAFKQKVRARKTGGGKTAARKVKARKEQYRTRRRGKSTKSR